MSRRVLPGASWPLTVSWWLVWPEMRCFWDGNTLGALLSFAGSWRGLAGGGCGSLRRAIVKCCVLRICQAASWRVPFLKVLPASKCTSCWCPVRRLERFSADWASLNIMARLLRREPLPLVLRCLSRIVANVDSIGFVVRRCGQSSAGKS